MLAKTLVVSLSLFFFGWASAQEAPPAAKTKRLKVSFEDQMISADAPPNAEAEYLFTRDQFNYKKLIKLRENFIPEATDGKREFGGK